ERRDSEALLTLLFVIAHGLPPNRLEPTTHGPVFSVERNEVGGTRGHDTTGRLRLLRRQIPAADNVRAWDCRGDERYAHSVPLLEEPTGSPAGLEDSGRHQEDPRAPISDDGVEETLRGRRRLPSLTKTHQSA